MLTNHPRLISKLQGFIAMSIKPGVGHSLAGSDCNNVGMTPICNHTLRKEVVGLGQPDHGQAHHCLFQTTRSSQCILRWVSGASS